jgi:hypothetical protein
MLKMNDSKENPFPQIPKRRWESKQTNTMNKTSFPLLPPLLSQRSHFNSFPFDKTQIFSPYKPWREKATTYWNSTPLSSKQSWVQNYNKTHDSTHNIAPPPLTSPHTHPTSLPSSFVHMLLVWSINWLFPRDAYMLTCIHVGKLVPPHNFPLGQ